MKGSIGSRRRGPASTGRYGLLRISAPLPAAANTDPKQINPFFTNCADRCVKWQTPKKRVGAGVTSLFYGAWIARASDGMFVAELADFPEITAIGANQKQAA